MATYYTSSTNNQRDSQMIYLRENLSSSYPESANMMMYMNPSSYAESANCVELSSMDSATQQQHQQQQKFFPNLGGSRMEEILVMNNNNPISNILEGRSLPGQGLSLSLGNQISQMNSIPFRNPTSNVVSSLLNPNMSIPVEGSSRNNGGPCIDEHSRNADFILASRNQDLSSYGVSNISRVVTNSKYLKAAQQLLDEVVNVRKALKKPDTVKNQSSSEKNETGSRNNSSNPTQESTSSELSHAEKQELQNKLTKLLSMLDEVDRRYKQYYHQMQIVVSSFDVIAGCGAAKPYTAVAQQTISRHFRCLHDAISAQIQSIRKTLGDQDSSENGVGITRLRYVDQQLKQQRAIHQLGMMQPHAWRPQRGLPETSVSILRAWLFEHFLHPYPKESDKIMLARQTGLTRSQVSNWFINARVRLWKPMVEEMYKEEFADVEMDSNSSSDNLTNSIRSDGTKRTNEDRAGQDLPQSKRSTSQPIDPNSITDPDLETTAPTTTSVKNHTQFVCETGNTMVNTREEPRPGLDDYNIFSPNGGGNRFMAMATDGGVSGYHMPDSGRFLGGNDVSLTLGLQHRESGNLPMAGGSHQSFLDMYNQPTYTVNTDAGANFECINPENRTGYFRIS